MIVFHRVDCIEFMIVFHNFSNIQVVTPRQCTNRLYGNMFIGSCYRVALNLSCSCNNESTGSSNGCCNDNDYSFMIVTISTSSI